MTTEARKVIALLSELIKLIERNGGHWSPVFKQYRSQLEKGDRSVIDSILSVYGGMGSFTDYVIPGEDGKKLLELSEKLNMTLKQMKKSGWKSRGRF